MRTFLLALAGMCLGLIGWALCGIGLTELGLLARFDPFDVAEDGPASSWATTAVEWSFPVWAALGAWATPRVLPWMLRSPQEIERES